MIQLWVGLSRIPVNKGIKSWHGWTKYSDLYEIVPPPPPQASTSFFLCLLTAVECGKGLLGRKVMIFVFLHLCFLSPISPQNSSARFLAFSSQKSGRNFSYEPKAKLVPVTGLIWRRPQKNIRTKYIKRYHHYQCQIKGWPNKTIN